MRDDARSIPARPNFSPERRATALSWIRGEGLLGSGLTEDAQILAAVGLLICDDMGRIKQADLQASMCDPSVIQAARNLLKEAAI